MDANKLKEILDKHEKWLNGEPDGERAWLSGANLSNANLLGANLCQADLSYADLRNANLQEANLSRANLHNATLYCANLIKARLDYAFLANANLSFADLLFAKLYNADLHKANLFNADLRYAELLGVDWSFANLTEAELSNAKNIPFVPTVCPDSGSFIAWKKAHGCIVKLLIPKNARRSSATTRKCRADKAKVLAIETEDGKPSGLECVSSDHDIDFLYKIGETVEEPNFCEDRFEECAAGIHFFVNRQEAVNYN
jgi:hypothetical protein